MDYNFHYNYQGFQHPDTDRSILMRDGQFRMNLFREFNYSAHDKYPPLYTMRELPFEGLPSAYLIYMTSESEYEAAMKLVGSWAHWQRLQKAKLFMDGSPNSHTWSGLNQWRAEKEEKRKAKALELLQSSAEGGNVTAQKILFEGDKARGRPSKAEIARQVKKETEEKQAIKDDLKRIQLATVDGKQATGN